jgi:5-keto 4-deoxyuronate isomerase
MIHRDSSENRDLRSSRDYFLLIKLFSSSVVTSIWSHQNRILIFVLIDLSTISKISKYERNHLDLNKSSRLNDRRTTRFEINRLIKKLTIRIVSNKQMRFEVESFMHEELNDDVIRQKSADQIRWSNHLIKKISSRKESSSARSRFAISSTHLIISNYHDTASFTIFQQFHIDKRLNSFFI